MGDMKCPFCKEEIISDVCSMFDKKDKDYTNGRQIYKCNKCGWFGNKELWEELIRTHKALDVAVDALNTLLKEKNEHTQPDLYVLTRALKEITALEQKEQK